MKPLLRSLFLLLTLMSILTAMIGCSTQQGMVSGLNPVLSISEPPALGKIVKLTLTFTAIQNIDYQNENITYNTKFILPPTAYEVVEGEIETEGIVLKPGEKHSVSITVKSILLGDGTLYGDVLKVVNNVSHGGAEDVLHIQIFENSAYVSESKMYDGGPTVHHVTPLSITPGTPPENTTTNPPSGTKTIIVPSPYPEGAKSAVTTAESTLKPVLSMSEPPETGDIEN